jgi:membrane protease YdiL (CAAX protease family)
MKSKWLAIIPPYLAVWAGIFLFQSAWIALLGFHVGILLALFWLKPQTPNAVLFKPASWKSVLLSVFLCGMGGVGLYLFWNWFAIAPDLNAKILALGLNAPAWLGFVAYFSFINPFMEEYFWRGVLGSDTRSLYIGDLAYAGFHAFILWNKAHLISVFFALMVLVAIGWFWRQVYRRDGSLLAPVLGHMAADLSILLAVYLRN